MAKGQIKQAYEKAKKEKKLQKLFDALKGGLNRDTAIAYAGLPKRSVYERMKAVENFRTEIEDSEEYRFAIVENEKNKLIKEGHRPAIDKELKSKKRDIYGDKFESDGTLKHIGEIIVKLPGKENDDD